MRAGCAAILALMAAVADAAEPAPAFDLGEIRVLGNTVLDVRSIEGVVYPFLGPGKSLKDVEAARKALGAVLARDGRIDVWVNNAGRGLLDSVAEMEMAAFRDMFGTNFFGAVAAMQAVIPVMRQQGTGTIINISSVAGHIPLPFHAGYSATKFALNAIGKAARVELKGAGIHMLTVCPGYVRTGFGENEVIGTVKRRVRPESVRGITAERVARATLRGYLKQKREVIVPWAMHIPVKFYQLFPAVVERAMARMAG